MATDKIILVPTVEEIVNGMTFDYSMVSGLFPNKEKYELKEKNYKFTEVNAKTPIVLKQENSQDTERATFKVGKDTKEFKAFVYAITYKESDFQETSDFTKISSKCVYEMSKQLDIQSVNGKVNGGILNSSDVNYVSNSAVSVPAGATRADTLATTIQDILDTIADKNQSTSIRIMVWGKTLRTAMITRLDPTLETTVQQFLQAQFPAVQFLAMPDYLNPSNFVGFTVVCTDRVLVRYTEIPNLADSDRNKEKNYYYMNFLAGTMMYDVQAPAGIVKQPLTLA